jgi:hypothetical protein
MHDEARRAAVVDALLRQGAAAWREFLAGRDDHFHLFIPADQRVVYERLRELRAGAHSFLELGAGMGVITILADLLGFDAFGIEIEPELVEESRSLAARFDSGATFAEGSFVPADYRDEIALLDAEFHSPAEGADAYAELGMEIADFDLVYVYPWPGEEEWARELVRRNAGANTMLLTYSVSEGVELHELR